MKRIPGIPVLAGLLMTGLLAWTRPALAQLSDIAQGADVYGKMCGRCHNARSPLERTDRDWVVIVNHMRVRGNLTGAQVRTVLAFLQGTNSSPEERVPIAAGVESGGAAPVDTSGPVSTDPTAIGRGRDLVTAKACVGCHVVGGGGGQVGPSLNGVVRRRSPGFVRQKLTTPTFNNATSMMPNFGLSKEEIDAILAYLATLGRQ